MSTIRRAPILALALFLLSVSGCSRTDWIKARGTRAIPHDVAVKFSGIWYDRASRNVGDPVTMDLSWGTQELDYKRGFYIDLLATQPRLGMADMHLFVERCLVSKSGKTIQMTLTWWEQGGSPAGGLEVKMIGTDLIHVTELNSRSPRLGGDYFKLDGPGL
jgi:hypothetical protein